MRDHKARFDGRHNAIFAIIEKLFVHINKQGKAAGRLLLNR